MKNGLLTIIATGLFRVLTVLVKALPRPITQILRRWADIAERTHILGLILPKSHVLGDLGSIAAARKTVLVVSHEGSRTGAPILSYNLVLHLLKRYNVVALFLGPGPLLDACHAAGATVVGPVRFRGGTLFSGLVIKQIMDAVPMEFALVNSIESRSVLPALAQHHVPTVSLIHEFSAYTRPRKAFYDTLFWADQTVFSARITRDNMIEENPDLDTRAYPVIPQGRCILPQEGGHEEQKRTGGESNRIQRTMRPKGFAAEGIVVLGAGFVQLRKGVDLFIECAAHILRKAPALPFRFVWVGKGYDPEDDLQYSVYLADQIRRAGLENHVCFMDEVVSLAEVYAAADILLLSSRLDPLPNVAIDALASRLPVVCFDKTTGIADILNEHELGDSCVAGYLDTENMACKVLALAQSKELRDQVAERAAQIAAQLFDMAAYVARIELLALQEVDRLKQTEADIETIAKSDLLRMDYYRSAYLQYQSRDEAIRWYVRSWAAGVERRKFIPGFHPGIYCEQHGVGTPGSDPLADYLRAGQPKGPWNFALITANEEVKPLPAGLRIGLHIHAYYPELFPEILRRLERNRVRPDLLISVTSESARQEVATQLGSYEGQADIRVVPNRGRDIGPFLTEFSETIRQKYDLIGHLHTKKSAFIEDQSFSRDWYVFLLENLIGGQTPMADVILGRMAADRAAMMVFPDDPYVVGWGRNFRFAENIVSDLGIRYSKRELCFPVGTMFWARTSGLKTLFDLNLSWDDYPEEPLPYDGSLLHALERLFGLLPSVSEGHIVLTNVAGCTR